MLFQARLPGSPSLTVFLSLILLCFLSLGSIDCIVDESIGVEQNVIIYSLHFHQLGISVTVSTCCKIKLLWRQVKASFIFKYKDTGLECRSYHHLVDVGYPTKVKVSWLHHWRPSGTVHSVVHRLYILVELLDAFLSWQHS